MSNWMFEWIIIAWFMGYLHRYMWKHMKSWYTEIKELNSKSLDKALDFPEHSGASKRND